MADNTVLPVMTGGDTLAADDIGGVKFLRGKWAAGADGAPGVDVSATNPWPVLTDAVTAHDAVDAKNPVKVGAVVGDAPPLATADGRRVQSRGGVSGELFINSDTPIGTIVGKATLVGTVAHDEVDDGTNPIKIAGFASGLDAGNPPDAVQDGDRVNAWYDRSGRRVLTIDLGGGGDVRHDSPETSSFIPWLESLPIKKGGRATTIAPSVNDGDRVAAWHDEGGYQHVKVDTKPVNAIGGDVVGGANVVGPVGYQPLLDGGPQQVFLTPDPIVGNVVDVKLTSLVFSVVATAGIPTSVEILRTNVVVNDPVTGLMEIKARTPVVLPPTPYGWAVGLGPTSTGFIYIRDLTQAGGIVAGASSFIEEAQ